MEEGLSAGIEPALLASVKSALRKDLNLDFVKEVKVELKGERTEPRLLALSTYRLYTLVNTKQGCKVESSIHILSIQSIESTKPLILSISSGDKPQLIKVAQPKDCTEIIAYIIAALKCSFPSGNPDRLLRLKLSADSGEDRQEQVMTLVNNLRNAEVDTETGPCGGFSRVYACMCDYHGVPYLEEVAWDVDTIYLSHNTKEFNLQDFDHLEQKELVPVVSALEYTSWFTKLVCRSFKLSSDVCDAVLRVLKKSTSIEELVLDGVSLGRDYFQKMALALTSNPKSALNVMDLSNNSMEDRGLSHLTGVIGKLPQGLAALTLAENNFTSKGSQSLGQALKGSKYMDSSLKRLNLSKNPLKSEGVLALSDFLANPNALTHLDLSYTECALDVLFGALMRGCVQNLMHLHLAGNLFTTKKKDATIPLPFQQFFSMAQVLEVVNVSDCRLPADAVRAILLGLSENSALVEIELNLSKNELRSSGAAALAEHLPKVANIKKLDISENGLESDLVKVFESLGSNQSIKQLYVGQNFEKKNPNATLEALVQLISEENSHINTLSIADSRLKQDVTPLLDALGTNETLVELDISGNQMGDEGARILAKALQLNTKLRKLHWDRNGTTRRGFGDISAALASNHALHSLPTPLIDVSQCIKNHQTQVERHLREIERFLLRNQSPHKMVTEQAYRLQQGLLVTSIQQQAVDRLIVQLQDMVNGLRGCTDPDVEEKVSKAKRYIQDADKMKQLLLKFQLCTDDSDVEAKFAKLTEEFYHSSQDKMKRNLELLLECAHEVCPYITEQVDVKASLSSVSNNKQRLSQAFVEEVVLGQASATILNRLSEDKLSAASLMADTIMDLLIRHMEACAITLDKVLKEQRKKQVGALDKALDTTDDISVAARKAKNRLSSTHQMTGENTEEVPKSHRRRPTVSRSRPKPDEGISEAVEVDIVIAGEPVTVDGGVAKTREAKPSPVATKKPRTSSTDEKQATPSSEKEPRASRTPSPSDSIDFGAVETGDGLQHLVKERARPARGRRLPTRPSNRPQATNGEQAEDEPAAIDNFWSTGNEELAKPSTTPSKPSSSTPSKPTSKPSKPEAAVPSKTPPKPAPKPKPKPRSSPEDPDDDSPERDTKDSKKQGWIPKGGINLGLPGFFKKKNRDRSGSGNEASDNGRAAHAQARITSSLPNLAVEEKHKESTTPSPKKSEREKKTSPTPPRPAPARDRAASGPGPKPAVKPRDRLATAPPGRPPAPHTREKIAPVPSSKPAGTKEPAKDEESQQSKPPAAAARGPPKFGIGMGGGLAGGGLLAEMKMRQERTGSFGEKNNKVPDKEKKSEEDGRPPRPRLPTEEREPDAISEEGLVRPSSVKRPRAASGPKPYVKPRERPRRTSRDEAEGAKAEEAPAKPKLKIAEKPEEPDLWVKRDDLPSPKRSPRTSSPPSKSPFSPTTDSDKKHPLSAIKPKGKIADATAQPAKADRKEAHDPEPPPEKTDGTSPTAEAYEKITHEEKKPKDDGSSPPAKHDGTAHFKHESSSPLARAATFPKPWSSTSTVPSSRSLPRKFSSETEKNAEDLAKQAKKEGEGRQGETGDKAENGLTSDADEKPLPTEEKLSHVKSSKIPDPSKHASVPEPINDPLGVSCGDDDNDTAL
ncbi:F-actin-uncapping protein LRRC16A isoform X2 [Nematostella vectensis]|uniref:F-actin-uncapping protein LRRC16A isoform X2 n=1 Tax=Nematostella vectensis TaxID=45351 RepID=UPI002077739A|nr:F-actin-uncapping protein LRRC16A isoform X2 [Nematostella vectensis]